MAPHDTPTAQIDRTDPLWADEMIAIWSDPYKVHVLLREAIQLTTQLALAGELHALVPITYNEDGYVDDEYERYTGHVQRRLEELYADNLNTWADTEEMDTLETLSGSEWAHSEGLAVHQPRPWRPRYFWREAYQQHLDDIFNGDA